MPANCGRRRIQELRDLGDREAVYLETLYDQPAPLRQCGKRPPKPLSDLAALRRLGGRRTPIAQIVAQNFGRARRSRRRDVQPPIDDDARQPGPERSRQVEAVDMLQRRQKRVLNEILGVLAMPQQPHRERHRSRQIPLDDSPERVTLPIPNAREKLAFSIRISARAKHERCT